MLSFVCGLTWKRHMTNDHSNQRPTLIGHTGTSPKLAITNFLHSYWHLNSFALHHSEWHLCLGELTLAISYCKEPIPFLRGYCFFPLQARTFLLRNAIGWIQPHLSLINFTQSQPVQYFWSHIWLFSWSGSFFFLQHCTRCLNQDMVYSQILWSLAHLVLFIGQVMFRFNWFLICRYVHFQEFLARFGEIFSYVSYKNPKRRILIKTER